MIMLCPYCDGTKPEPGATAAAYEKRITELESKLAHAQDFYRIEIDNLHEQLAAARRYIQRLRDDNNQLGQDFTFRENPY